MTGSPVPVRTPLPHVLAGRTVVVAGGSSGIGLAAAVLLRTVGARVVVLARDTDAAVAAAVAAMPLGRLATAEEIAGAAVFRMANPIVTGSVLAVDGGQALA